MLGGLDARHEHDQVVKDSAHAVDITLFHTLSFPILRVLPSSSMATQIAGLDHESGIRELLPHLRVAVAVVAEAMHKNDHPGNGASGLLLEINVD